MVCLRNKQKMRQRVGENFLVCFLLRPPTFGPKSLIPTFKTEKKQSEIKRTDGRRDEQDRGEPKYHQRKKVEIELNKDLKNQNNSKGF